MRHGFACGRIVAFRSAKVAFFRSSERQHTIVTASIVVGQPEPQADVLSTSGPVVDSRVGESPDSASTLVTDTLLGYNQPMIGGG